MDSNLFFLVVCIVPGCNQVFRGDRLNNHYTLNVSFKEDGKDIYLFIIY